MIKAVLWSDQRPYSVYRRMNALRSTLEDWMGREITRGRLEGPEFFDVYYHDLEDGDPFKSVVESREGVIVLLGDLRKKLQTAYPDCAPLRQQLRRIDMSVALIGKMKSAKV